MYTINYDLITNIDSLSYVGQLVKEQIMDKPNISRIARKLNCSRDTVRKRLNGEEPSNTRRRIKYLDNYYDVLLDTLSNEYKSFSYVKHLFNYFVREYDIKCCYTTFREYVMNDIELSRHFKKSNERKFTERFETPPGKQAQFDLKEDVEIIFKDGSKTKVHIATLTLGFSRYNIRQVIIDKSYESVSRFLANAFEKLGGVYGELVIDNIKCLVDKPRTYNTDAIINAKFIEFAKDYGFEIKPCMPYRAQTKGKTESQNKVVEQLLNYNGDYNDLYDVCDKLVVINTEDNDSVSQATLVKSSFLLKKEKLHFKPLPPRLITKYYFPYTMKVKVSNDSLITYKSRKYSVPKRYIGKTLNVIVKNNLLHIYYNREIVTIHQISNKMLNINKNHNLKYNKILDIEEINNPHVLSVEIYERIKYDNV